MTISSLDRTLAALWANWAFRLSLSSNELFHSNVLQYLAEGTATAPAVSDADETDGGGPSPAIEDVDEQSEPEVISVDAARNLLDLLCVERPDRGRTAYDRLNVLEEGTLLSVKREWSRMDLVVLVPEAGRGKSKTLRPLFALEVKVKDYPEARQLKRYRNALDQSWSTTDMTTEEKACCYSPPLFLLTGMGEEALMGDLAGSATHRLDFGELASGLVASTGAVGPIGKEYIALCRSLDDLFRELRRQLSDELSWEEARKMGGRLTRFRLHSLWWKLWAAYVRRRCEALISEDLKATELALDRLQFYSGFTKTGNLGICWHWANPPEPAKPQQAISLGVQIEGCSVRLFLNVIDFHLGRAGEARLAVEAALLKLLRTRGVFASNPVMGVLQDRWNQLLEKGEGSYTNLDIWRELDHDEKPLPEPTVEDLVKKEPGTGQRIGDAMPMLTGYANGPGNGFADIRLTLKREISVGKVAEMVRDILVRDVFSAPQPGKTHLLFRVVQSFVDAEDKSAWLGKPTVA